MPAKDAVRADHNRDCPICDGAGRRSLYRQRFAEMSSGNLMTGYDVAVCEACGFVYADGIPSQAELDAHYRDMSKYERQEYGGRESGYDLARFRAMADIVSRVVPDRGVRILDVGCAIGGFLAVLKSVGYERLLGLDPSPACATAAWEVHEVRVLTGTLANFPEGANFPPGDWQFDLILLSNILEHVRDLRPALTKLRGLLSATGMIYVQVPDASRFANRDDAPFQEFSTEHINFFSSISLANLMRTAGFEMVFSENTAYDQDHAARLPVVDAIFQRASAPPPLERDQVTQRDLQDYIAQSSKVDDRIQRTIDGIIARNEAIVVWGVGTHTLRLLETSNLAKARITAFVDSNPRIQGKELRGIPVLPPASLREMPEPVLISSRVFQRNIEEQINKSMGLGNRLYLLYDL